MRILVIGAGEVGSSIAGSLADAHEIVVLDVDGERVDSLTFEHDVLAIQGDGTSLDDLEAADVGSADVVIASTDEDETNLAACGTVKTVTDAFTIARVEQPSFLRTWQRSRGVFGVDFMVCTDLLTAQAIVRIVGLPTARDVDPFANGLVQMAEFEVDETSPLAGQTVAEADTFDALTFVALVRDEEVVLPRGDTVIEQNDQIVVIGRPDRVEAFAGAVSPEAQTDVEDVVVVGGSTTAYQVARLLEERGLSPTLIEQDEARARELAELLPNTTVLQHDATDRDFLEREHVGDADFVVSMLDSDEKNLLVALLTKRVGAARTVAVADNPQYVPLFQTVGVDVAVNPREVTAEDITRFTRERQAENVAIIEPDKAEVLEVEVDADSVLVGRPIREAVADLPAGFVIGAITRDGEFVTPRGDTVVEPNDHVIALVTSEAHDEVAEKL
ncbi:Trk system potassium transporter TrkA [Salarchaeum japonicum]|uniref:Trk system potassium transporter TrkA n=1 Tax=Salarchaeum japonicum TaxID=555573 RepID=UPI003C762554